MEKEIKNLLVDKKTWIIIGIIIIGILIILLTTKSNNLTGLAVLNNIDEVQIINDSIMIENGILTWNYEDKNFDDTFGVANDAATVYYYDGDNWLYNYADSGVWNKESGFEQMQNGQDYIVTYFTIPVKIDVS